MHRHNIGPHLISLGGGAIMVIELYRYWKFGTPIGMPVLGVGGFFVWLGGYLADRKAAIEGGSFVVDSVAKLIAVVRTGRRTGDVKAIVVDAPDETKGI